MILLHMVGNANDFGLYLIMVHRKLWKVCNHVKKDRLNFLFKETNNSGRSVEAAQEWSAASS